MKISTLSLISGILLFTQYSHAANSVQLIADESWKGNYLNFQVYNPQYQSLNYLGTLGGRDDAPLVTEITGPQLEALTGKKRVMLTVARAQSLTVSTYCSKNNYDFDNPQVAIMVSENLSDTFSPGNCM